MAFTMTRFSSVKPLYEGFIVKINDRDRTVNIMMHGEIGLVLITLRDKMDTLVREHCPMCATVAMDEGLERFPLLKRVFYYEHYRQTESCKFFDRYSTGIEGKHF
jgi:hypothetical protein